MWKRFSTDDCRDCQGDSGTTVKSTPLTRYSPWSWVLSLCVCGSLPFTDMCPVNRDSNKGVVLVNDRKRNLCTRLIVEQPPTSLFYDPTQKHYKYSDGSQGFVS